MNIKATLLSGILLFTLAMNANAERYKYENTRSNKGDQAPPGTAANCTPATAATELNINNTKALIQSGGDMWWDFNRSRYEIPSGSERTSLFAGSLWLAGQDVSGQFKVAALRFRQIGNDYWTGPLSTVDAEIDPATCKIYDRHWETTRSMVAEFAGWWQAGEFDAQNGTNTQDELYPAYTIPTVIEEWPAHGRNFEPYNEDYYLAPFFDRNGDGDYNVADGDYPGYVLSGKSDCSRRVRDIYGDQNIWWVFNDKGNIHSESGGQSIGMEIRAQAFAFATTDEVNNMTFYNYELINRSTFELADTYFGQWADGDLGNANDDFVGCDVRRGLGYFYNGDDEDEDAGGNRGYGVNPPAVGIDFFQGPFQANDNRDNCLCTDDFAAAIAEDGIVYSGQGAGYGDDIVDNERYGMRKFLYHNNAAGPTGDPSIATDYYNMLRGIWKDGTPMTFGGNGYDPSNANAIPAGYMFPGDTDPTNWGTDGIDPGQGPWTEVTAGNNAGDRRFVQSSGPFRLGPGAVNNITVGVVWMQATSGGRLQSVEDMRKADDKTQALFDSCFEILDGPHAPDVAVQELDREVILMLSNPINSNNYQEGYETVDPFLAAPDSLDIDGDGQFDIALTSEEKALYGTYKFEGYQIYQLADGSVGTNDLDDPDKARLIAQVDVANGISRLVNYEYDSQIDADVPSLKVDGENQGIRHSFQITEDRFASGDARLINHKTYYFMAIAYAYNQYGDGEGNLEFVDGVYDPSADPPRLDGQKIPYLASRTSPNGPVRVYEVIPHRTQVEQNGIQLNAQYGDGVELTRIEGRGNGGNYAVIKEDYIDSALVSESLERVTYEQGLGPVNVKVVDPLAIPPGNFTLAFKDSAGTKDYENMHWELTGDGIETVSAEQAIKQNNEQVIFDLGLSISVNYGYPANEENAVNNGYIGFDVIFDDETDQWLSGLPDVDADPTFNWIKSGKYLQPAPLTGTQDFAQDDHWDNYRADPNFESENSAPIDEEQIWENIAGRTWSPFALASYDTAHPIPCFPIGQSIGLGSWNASERIIQFADIAKTPSVDVVITANKELWTRCPVLEAQDNALLTKGNAIRGELRRGLSVDKNGLTQLDDGHNAAECTMNGTQVVGDFAANLRQSDIDWFTNVLGIEESKIGDFSFGMGWFPGYAINVETGERLNMAFAEDSWLAKENGADMVWNPTENVFEPLFNELRLGGKHMIYVFRHNTEEGAVLDDNRIMPAYDNGDFAFNKLLTFDANQITHVSAGSTEPERLDYLSVMRAGAWVGYPLLAEGAQLFGVSQENNVTIRLRSTQPYQPYAAGIGLSNPSALTVGETYYVDFGKLSVSQSFGDSVAVVTFHQGQVFTAEATTYTSVTTEVTLIETENGGLPLYRFNTDALAPTVDIAIGVDALDEIKAVPNPYYAYSEYETNRLDYEVKIINLPEVCTVNIFTVNGTLVRTFEKDNAASTSIDWDLKNQDNIPIASGMYIIHVNAPGIGEKVVKWFGVLRPIDLNSF